ncbi:MAG: DUF3040 domain-containing protein [Saccharothrix sp.]|nr:DUF3040 domain-containing protein [Saccharothrix sp.]
MGSVVRERLREIERVLATTDPGLARACSPAQPDEQRPPQWPWRVLWICGVVMALAGCLSVSFFPVVVGSSWIGVGLVMAARIRRWARQPGDRSGNGG